MVIKSFKIDIFLFVLVIHQQQVIRLFILYTALLIFAGWMQGHRLSSNPWYVFVFKMSFMLHYWLVLLKLFIC